MPWWFQGDASARRTTGCLGKVGEIGWEFSREIHPRNLWNLRNMRIFHVSYIPNKNTRSKGWDAECVPGCGLANMKSLRFSWRIFTCNKTVMMGVDFWKCTATPKIAIPHLMLPLAHARPRLVVNFSGDGYPLASCRCLVECVDFWVSGGCFPQELWSHVFFVFLWNFWGLLHFGNLDFFKSDSTIFYGCFRFLK